MDPNEMTPEELAQHIADLLAEAALLAKRGEIGTALDRASIAYEDWYARH